MFIAIQVSPCLLNYRCADNYLPVGDNCVDENVIIGVSVGVGCALILGLVISLVILGSRYHKNKQEYDDL